MSNNRDMLNAAKSMGLSASRDHTGAVTLIVPADFLPPRLREFAVQIAEPFVEPPNKPEVLQVVADTPEADAEAHRNTTTQEALGGELRSYLTQLARQTRSRRPDAAKRPEVPPSQGFLEKLRAGGYTASSVPNGGPDFADFVRRLSESIDRAIDRHGETRRLEHLRSMIDAIYALGVDRYEREDSARAARLLAIGPEILTRLDSYKPDPQSPEDRLSDTGPARRIA